MQPGSLELQVAITGVPNPCTAFYIAEGARVVVDCPGASVPANKSVAALSAVLVKKVRIGSHPSMFRLVLDLARAEEPSISVDAENRVTLRFSAGPEFDLDAPPPAATASPVPTPPPPKLFTPASTPASTAVPTPVVTSSPSSTPEPTVTPAPVITEIPRPVPTDRPVSTPRVTPSGAQLEVDRRLIEVVSGDRGIENVVISNPSEETVVVETQSMVVHRPGTSDEGLEESDTLLVSPKRFSMEPGSRRTIRLLLKEPATDGEELFRVTLLSTCGTEAAPTIELLYRERGAEPHLEWHTSGGLLEIRNDGRASCSLEEGKCCKAESCVNLPGKRLHPGNRWSLKVPSDCQITFVKAAQGAFEQISFTARGGDAAKR